MQSDNASVSHPLLPTTTGAVQHNRLAIAPTTTALPQLHVPVPGNSADVFPEDDEAPVIVAELVQLLASPGFSFADLASLAGLCRRLKSQEDGLVQTVRGDAQRRFIPKLEDAARQMLIRLAQSVADAPPVATGDETLAQLHEVFLGLAALLHPAGSLLSGNKPDNESRQALLAVTAWLYKSAMAAGFPKTAANSGMLVNMLNLGTRELESGLVQDDDSLLGPEGELRQAFCASFPFLEAWVRSFSQQQGLSNHQMAKCAIQIRSLYKYALIPLTGKNMQRLADCMFQLCSQPSLAKLASESDLAATANFCSTMQRMLQDGLLPAGGALEDALTRLVGVLEQVLQSQCAIDMQAVPGVVGFLRYLLDTGWHRRTEVPALCSGIVNAVNEALKLLERCQDQFGSGDGYFHGSVLYFCRALDLRLTMPREQYATLAAASAHHLQTLPFRWIRQPAQLVPVLLGLGYAWSCFSGRTGPEEKAVRRSGARALLQSFCGIEHEAWRGGQDAVLHVLLYWRESGLVDDFDLQPALDSLLGRKANSTLHGKQALVEAIEKRNAWVVDLPEPEDDTEPTPSAVLLRVRGSTTAFSTAATPATSATPPDATASHKQVVWLLPAPHARLMAAAVEVGKAPPAPEESADGADASSAPPMPGTRASRWSTPRQEWEHWLENEGDQQLGRLKQLAAADPALASLRWGKPARSSLHYAIVNGKPEAVAWLLKEIPPERWEAPFDLLMTLTPGSDFLPLRSSCKALDAYLRALGARSRKDLAAQLKKHNSVPGLHLDVAAVLLQHGVIGQRDMDLKLETSLVAQKIREKDPLKGVRNVVRKYFVVGHHIVVQVDLNKGRGISGFKSFYIEDALSDPAWAEGDLDQLLSALYQYAHRDVVLERARTQVHILIQQILRQATAPLIHMACEDTDLELLELLAAHPRFPELLDLTDQYQRTPLALAAQRGDMRMVTELFRLASRHGVRPESLLRQERVPPASQAARHGHAGVLKLFLSFSQLRGWHAQLRKERANLLHAANASENPEAVAAVLAFMPELACEPADYPLLLEGAVEGKTKLVALLLKQPAPWPQRQLELASSKKQWPVARLTEDLLHHKEPGLALLVLHSKIAALASRRGEAGKVAGFAIYHDAYEVLQAILAHKPSPLNDEDLMQLLLMAADIKDGKAFSMLLPYAPHKSLMKRDGNGWTIAHLLAALGLAQQLREFLNLPSTRDSLLARNLGLIPLQVAATAGHVETVRCLLDAGLARDQMLATYKGEQKGAAFNALQIAALHGKLRALFCMCNYAGASEALLALSPDGQTVLNMLREDGYEASAQELLALASLPPAKTGGH